MEPVFFAWCGLVYLMFFVIGAQLTAGSFYRRTEFAAHSNGNMIFFEHFLKGQNPFPAALCKAQILCLVIRNQINMKIIIAD